jgi:LacI family transcriptional regulator
MESTVTLDKVARQAGVSSSTVSRIINGTANVSAVKRENVLRIMSELNYHPNVLARGLASGRTMGVGVLTQDISSPFYGSTLRGIEGALQGTGYHPIFISGHWHVQEELEAIDFLISRQVDGVIVLGGGVPDRRLQEVAHRLPVVVMGRSVPGLENQCMRLDNFAGAYQATRHLIELGHRNIAHIAGEPSHRDAQDRTEGYRAALDSAGLPFSPDLVQPGDFHEAAGFLATTRLVEGRSLFSAIFAANDQMAYGARLALHRKGLRVPEDVSLIGFDDLPGSMYTTPPLTTVQQPVEEMGRAAAEAMLRMLRGGQGNVEKMDVRLIIRESTLRRRSS